MTKRLPPLNALRAFEAAARHLSFTKAAEELAVTPTAISHQIRSLEDQIGTRLFKRLTRALMLTDTAQAGYPEIREAFEKLRSGVDKMRDLEDRGLLTVTASPTFAALWLVPRLDRFTETHPEITVRIDASIQLVDFQRDQVDIAIRYGRGHYPGLRSEQLFSECFSPVCSPELIDGPQPLRRPEDLADHVLLHYDWATPDAALPTWKMWLKAAGLEHIDAERGPRFSQQSMAVDAAVRGQGVALASDSMASHEIASGRLVRPFDLTLPTTFTYYLVSPEETAETGKVAAFRAWILDEIAAESRGASPVEGAGERRSPRDADDVA